MDDVAQLLVALGLGTIIAAVINWIANRKKNSAETEVLISGNAMEWAKLAMERAGHAESKADTLLRAKKRLERRVSALEVYNDQLLIKLRECNIEPPPFKHPAHFATADDIDEGDEE